ncbi:MAG: serine hydrolase domain-containing protein [Chitinophagaceae bacterium]
MPGTHYRYSNTAFCLLALIIEKVSGMSYQNYIQKNIFKPLAMEHSTVLKIGESIYRQAYGYEHDEKTKHFNKLDADESIFFSTEGDGGIYTSADDYLRWLAFLQKPSSQTAVAIKKCQSPQFAVDSMQKLFYGYGWFVSKKDSTPAIYHTGSNGGFRAIVFTLPAKNYIVTIFSNRTGVDLEKLLQQINEILGVTNNSFTKTEALVSFMYSWPIFAPCKKTS